MATQIQLRGDTAANWTAENPVLAQREIGIETDTDKIKIGDGSTLWENLPYFSSGGGGGITDYTYADLVTAIGGSTLTEGSLGRITDFETVHYFTDGTSVVTDVAQVDTITLSGDAGTAKIDVADGDQKTVTFVDTLENAASAFVTANDTYYASIGVILTSNVVDLIFTADVPGVGFTNAVITPATGTLDGVEEETQPNITGINVGANEPLIFMATSANTIDKRVYSALHPEDTIDYDWNSANWLNDVSFATQGEGGGIVPGFKGVITFRHDTLLDNSTGYDLREVKFRRWALNPDVYDSQVEYAAKAIVQNVAETIIYISLKGANSDNPLTDEDWWAEIVDMTSDIFLSWNSVSVCGINTDATNYVDVYTFGNTYYAVNCHIGIVYDETNLGWGLCSRLNNIIFSTGNNSYPVKDINIGTTSYWMSFYGDIYAVKIGNYSYSNIIGNGGNYLTTGNMFNSNVIGIYCAANFFSETVNNNYIGKSFNDNSCNTLFSSNVIGNSCSVNTFGEYFNSNVVKANFKNNFAISNISTIDFTDATHVYEAYSCTISKREDGTAVLTYIDNSLVQQIVLATA